ncbi:hypothetical protein ACE1N8_33105 (plasmid) [Streptomyces sp. DSM 116494]|uniref:hypothetical protein n=1 Tax=Streptomyces okerensis TaxID=3344655 RepID=UPI00388E440A
MRRRTLPAGALPGTAAAPATGTAAALAAGTARAAAPADFGEVVSDETRVAQDGLLPFVHREKSTGTTPSPLRVADFRLPARP